jgi:hypothetical protein
MSSVAYGSAEPNANAVAYIVPIRAVYKNILVLTDSLTEHTLVDTTLDQLFATVTAFAEEDSTELALWALGMGLAALMTRSRSEGWQRNAMYAALKGLKNVTLGVTSEGQFERRVRALADTFLHASNDSKLRGQMSEANATVENRA